LDLSENKFERILGPLDEGDFKTLISLRLNENNLNEWSSIDQLGRYTAIKTVWLGKNPIMNMTLQGEMVDGRDRHDARVIAISKMPHLQNMNGSEVRVHSFRTKAIWEAP
jgi:hypothetical protein